MATFYKVALEGSYVNKPIINILYYWLLGLPTTPFNAVRMADLGAQVAAVWATNALPHLPLGYNFQRAVVTMHDDSMATLGYQVEVSATGTGGLAETSDGRTAAGVIAFRTMPAEDSNSQRGLRSSYLAFGPLVSTLVDNAGAVLWPAGSDEDLAELCQRTYLLDDSETAQPVRVGKRPIDTYATICTIEQVIFRPFKGKRNSRGQSPTGQ